MQQPGTPERASQEGLRGFLRGPFLLAIAVATLAVLDPLGIEEGTAEHSEVTAMRLAAVLYPAFDPGKDRVTVVLLDEDYAKRTSGTWPLSYRQQGYLLSLIESFGPTAIFVDLIYNKPHDDAHNPTVKGDDPENLLSALPPDTSTPIYLAGLAPRGFAGKARCENTERVPDRAALIDEESVLAPIRAHPLIKGGDSGSRLALVEWEGCNDLYPLYVGDNPKAATPAYALYKEWACRDDASDQGRNECLSELEKREAQEQHYTQPMKVIWGAFPPRAQSPFYSFDACQYGYLDGKPAFPFWRRVGALLNQLRLAALPQKGSAPNDVLPCPALNVVPAAAFAGVDPENPAFRNTLEPLLKGRLVLIGASITGSSDVFASPVHGQLPGVEYHAMALDNLLRFDTRYVTEAPRWLVHYALPPLVLILIAWIMFSLPDTLWGLWRRQVEMAGLVVAAATAAASAIRGDPVSTVLAMVGGGLLFVIAPTALARSTISFVIVCGVGVLAILWGSAPTNLVLLAIASVAATEKIHASRHGRGEDRIVAARIDHVCEWVARGFKTRLRQQATSSEPQMKPQPEAQATEYHPEPHGGKSEPRPHAGSQPELKPTLQPEAHKG